MNQIDELLDFNGTVLRPAYMGAIAPMLLKRYKNQKKIPTIYDFTHKWAQKYHFP